MKAKTRSTLCSTVAILRGEPKPSQKSTLHPIQFDLNALNCLHLVICTGWMINTNSAYLCVHCTLCITNTELKHIKYKYAPNQTKQNRVWSGFMLTIVVGERWPGNGFKQWTRSEKNATAYSTMHATMLLVIRGGRDYLVFNFVTRKSQNISQ